MNLKFECEALPLLSVPTGDGSKFVEGSTPSNSKCLRHVFILCSTYH